MHAARHIVDDAAMPSAADMGLRALIRTRARDWDRRAAPLHAFGGRPLLDASLPTSRITGRPLPLAFDFDLSDPRLAGLEIRSVRRLAILAPYGVDLAARSALLIGHRDEGRRLEILEEPAGRVVDDIPELPQLPVELEPLSEAEAACDTVDQFPDDHGALHQIGGHPAWVTRAADPPRCPVTGLAMSFVAAVDSIRRFPLGGTDIPLAFGNGGMLYVYWSEPAAVSAAFVQSW